MNVQYSLLILVLPETAVENLKSTASKQIIISYVDLHVNVQYSLLILVPPEIVGDVLKCSASNKLLQLYQLCRFTCECAILASHSGTT